MFAGWAREGDGLIPAHAGKTPLCDGASPPGGAHPRSRGENDSKDSFTPPIAGSSPLTRGKLGYPVPLVARGGLIPAHAGKTWWPGGASPRSGAHPRSRGENRRSPRSTRHPGGSSPLTRGKPRAGRATATCTGLIPAHAGKTYFISASPRRAWAHPRSRGENAAGQARRQPGKGSSPLTRGKRRDAEVRGHVEGLIPAHAGKTSRTRAPTTFTTAHPRSRGENTTVAILNDPERGSSPLTRGKLCCQCCQLSRSGLIPAHAGKTPRAVPTCGNREAHPRSRGENVAGLGWVREGPGSSPLTRGKLVDAVAAAVEDGLIPAHAGKTAPAAASSCTSPAHPRSRGENSYADKTDVTGNGSSPLTRGKQCCLARPGNTDGLIPAHAGKTRRSGA